MPIRFCPPFYLSDGAKCLLLLFSLAITELGSFHPLFGQEQNNFDQQGFDAYKRGDFDNAIADYDRAIQSNSKDAKAFYACAIAYAKKGDFDNAIENFSEVIRLDPNSATAYNSRGNMYVREGNYVMTLYDGDKAIEDYNKAMDDYSKGIDDYEQAIELDPKKAGVYTNRGIAYYDKREFDLAIDDFGETTQLDSKNVRAYFLCGLACIQQNEYSKGISQLEQVIHLDPKNADAYDILALIRATCSQADLRDGKKAVQYAMIACELNGWKKPSMVRALAAAYAEAGDFDNAIKWQNYYLTFPNVPYATQAKRILQLYQTHQPYHAD